jgi:hypothetical protein
VDLEKPLFDQGLDSLMSVSLRNELKNEFGSHIQLKSTLVFDYPSVGALSGYLEEQLFGSPLGIVNKTAAQQETRELLTSFVEVESMTEKEVQTEIDSELESLKKEGFI